MLSHFKKWFGYENILTWWLIFSLEKNLLFEIQTVGLSGLWIGSRIWIVGWYEINLYLGWFPRFTWNSLLIWWRNRGRYLLESITCTPSRSSYRTAHLRSCQIVESWPVSCQELAAHSWCVGVIMAGCFHIQNAGDSMNDSSSVWDLFISLLDRELLVVCIWF